MIIVPALLNKEQKKKKKALHQITPYLHLADIFTTLS